MEPPSYSRNSASSSSAEILKHWLAAINCHEVMALTALMAADHVFVDSLGNRVNGANPWRLAGAAISRRGCGRGGQNDWQPGEQ